MNSSNSKTSKWQRSKSTSIRKSKEAYLCYFIAAFWISWLTLLEYERSVHKTLGSGDYKSMVQVSSNLDLQATENDVSKRFPRVKKIQPSFVQYLYNTYVMDIIHLNEKIKRDLETYPINSASILADINTLEEQISAYNKYRKRINNNRSSWDIDLSQLKLFNWAMAQSISQFGAETRKFARATRKALSTWDNQKKEQPATADIQGEVTSK